MNNTKTGALVEGAIFAAITVLIGLLTFYLPFLFFLSYFWAIPTILISYRHGFKISLISGVSAAIIIAMFLGPLISVSALITMLVPGMFLGFFMKRFKKQQNLILASAGVTVLCSLVLVVLTAVLTGVNPINIIDKSIAAIMLQITLASELLKMPVPKDLGDSVKQLIVALVMVAGVVITIFNLWLTQKILHRMKIESPKLEPISHWHLSFNGLIFVSASIVFILINMYFFKESKIMTDISLNLAVGLFYWFWFLGMATVVFFVNKTNLPKPVKVMIILGSALIIGKVCALAGYIEAAFDFRKLRPVIVKK